MTIFNKIKWILGIVLVFLLVLTTNLVDRQNFVVVKESMENIYADRLIAQDIILDLSKVIWEKETVYAGADTARLRRNNERARIAINEALVAFSATKLTSSEQTTYERLVTNLATLDQREHALLEGNGSLAEINTNLQTVKADLSELSAIQIQEGKRQMFAARKAISSADLFTQLEIGALIVLAISVQVIILYTPKMKGEEYGA